MRAVVSNKIYLVGDPQILKGIKKELTYEIPPKYTPPGQRPIPLILRSYKQLAPDMIAIPSGRMDLIPPTWELVDKRCEVPVSMPYFRSEDSLREEQLDLVEKALALKGSCILNAKPGWGKTFWAIYLATKLNQKTLVLVHTNNLLIQWAKEIEEQTGIKPGVANDGKFRDHPLITIALIGTAAKHIKSIEKTYGLVIMDEVHHLPADTFMEVMNGLYAKYKVGMTGTLRRTDKKEKVIFDYFSKNVFVAKDSNTLVPKVYVIRLPIDFDEYTGAYAEKITKLCTDPRFIRESAGIINSMRNEGYKVLYVSDRVQIVEELHTQIPTSVLLTGKTTDRTTVFNETRKGLKDTVLSTTRLFSEGLSENYLSCLVLGSFISSDVTLEQIAARVTRKYEGKLSPIIVDLCPKGRSMRSQLSSRIEFYESQGWEIIHTN